MTVFSKYASGAFVLALAAAVGVVLYQQNEIRSAKADVLRDAAAVAEAYRGIAERTVFPSENSTDLSQEQRKTAGYVRTAYGTLSEEKDLPDTVAAINALQVALIAYLRQSLASETLRTAPDTIALEQELGRDGSVRPLLDSYNTSAKAWNDIRETPAGTMRAHLLGENRDTLPFLRFDGQQEYVNVVEM
jgi:hypothetical protein